MSVENLTPEEIGRLVGISFVLEPLVDKPGCTTRHIDLDGKPLYDFLIAGVNSAQMFEEYARSYLNGGNREICSHYLKALKQTNHYKRKKYVNCGLLFTMFFVCRKRLENQPLKKTLNGFKSLLKKAGKKDVLNELESLKLSWSTSTKHSKTRTLQQIETVAKLSSSLYERFSKFIELNKDRLDSSYQHAEQFVNGLPLLKKFIFEIDDRIGLIESLRISYSSYKKRNPEMAAGVLADFVAAAIFLYLSYKDSDYEVR